MMPNAVVTLNYTGAVQYWTVPDDVFYVQIDAYGGEGGSGAGAGGLGGRATGILQVTPGEELAVYVGGGAGNRFNGGGLGVYSNNSGGGATDVRQGGESLSDRKIVAGGAGGGGSSGVGSVVGGSGGGASGGNGSGTGSGLGGTQSSGGTGGGGNGTLGIGGDGFSGGPNYGGGGGGGYFGGGGGGSSGSGGGGGSGYIGGVSDGTMTNGVRSGNGMLVIEHTLTVPTYPVGVTINRTVVNQFTWNFGHSDQGESQSKFDLQIREQGQTTPVVDVTETTSNEFYDLAADTLTLEDDGYEWRVRTYDQLNNEGMWSAWTPFTTFIIVQEFDEFSPDVSHTVVANSLSGGERQWRVRTFDESGEEGPWSGWETFEAKNPPSAPSQIRPMGEFVILSKENRFEWEFVDPDAGDTQSKFHIQIRLSQPTWNDLPETTTWDDIDPGIIWNNIREVIDNA